jgi:predicted O-linked N-acetylglucosamine transferase (SPINDLY family)
LRYDTQDDEAVIQETFINAVRHHQAGRLPAAEQLYRQILAVEPKHAGAWHLLGVIAHQVGNHVLAVQCIEHAISLDDGEATFHSNLGEAYRALRKTPEAIACYQRALRLKPDMAGIHYNLGNAWKDCGQLAEAITSYRRAVQLNPNYAEAHNNLGNALREQAQTAEAIGCFQRALQAKPDFAEAHSNLGLALQAEGRLDEAIARFHRAIELNPDAAEACSNLGNALREQGQAAAAIACFQRALQIKPEFAEAHFNLGYALQDQEQLTAAAECCRRAVQLKPDYAEAHNNLGVILKDQGRLAEAIAALRQAAELKPEYASAQSNLLLTMQYRDGVTLQELADAHQEFERRLAAPLRSLWPAHNNDRDPARPLRLGFLSPDLRRHPVAYFLIQVLEHLDRRQFDVVCYCDRKKYDELTARFQAAAGQWRVVAGESDERLAETIRADRIDILFDMAGHTAHARPLVFARRPAPIQIGWIGYEGTTGLAAVDYLLADRHLIPPESEPYYRERVLRMPEGYVCYDPPAAAPPVGPLPALGRGYATFGSFNNLAKITPEVVARWAAILGRLPQSRLLMKYRGLGDASVAQRYRDLFAEGGVAAERLDLQPPAAYADYLATYQQVDVALDPFPFTGGATTCESLWMGVPVITCPGETFASRHTLSHLANAGLTETVAGNLDQYAELAISWASDWPRLAALRARLREQMAGSPLCDGQRCADHLGSLLRDVWRQWCAQGAARR